MKNESYNPHRSSVGGLTANVMALLCYIAPIAVGFLPLVRYVAWLVPLVLFLLEKQSRFVKFHAMQSFLLHMVSAVLVFLVSVVLGGILGVGTISTATHAAAAGLVGIIGLLTTGISLLLLVLAIMAMVGAYRYRETHLPLIGSIAQHIALK